MSKLLICGGRNYSDKFRFYQVMDTLFGTSLGEKPNWSWVLRDDIEIVHGGAKGADQMADEFATSNFIPVKCFPADWEKYGKRAGFLRNIKMSEYLTPSVDLVIAFPGGKGTKHMIETAKKRNIAVQEVL